MAVLHHPTSAITSDRAKPHVNSVHPPCRYFTDRLREHISPTALSDVVHPVWNSLDSETLLCSSISGFKRRLKTLLFRQAFSSTTWTVRQRQRLWSHPTCWRYTNKIIIIIIIICSAKSPEFRRIHRHYLLDPEVAWQRVEDRSTRTGQHNVAITRTDYCSSLTICTWLPLRRHRPRWWVAVLLSTTVKWHSVIYSLTVIETIYLS